MGSGHFKSPKELEERGKSIRGGAGPSDDQVKVCKALQEVADEVGSGTHLAHSMFSYHIVNDAHEQSQWHGQGNNTPTPSQSLEVLRSSTSSPMLRSVPDIPRSQ